MRKIAISLSKGGVGKTTTAVSLAHGVARAGRRVLLVDTDTQGQVAKALGVAPAAGLSHLVAGELQAGQAVARARENLWLLAGDRSLAGITRLIDRKEFGAEQLVSEALAPLAGQFDYVILDTPPGWSSMTINVLFYADEILAPVSMEVLTLQGLVDFESSLKAIQKYRQALSLSYILPTFYDLRVKKSSEILQQLQGHYNQQLCTPIRYNVRLSEAPAYGQTIFEYAPRSVGAQDYL